MTRLAVVLGVALGVLLLPGMATAATFEVDTLESEANASTACVEAPFQCSLRDAIERANETTALDEIDFSKLFAGTIELDQPLPAVLWPVEIDATTAADYSDAGHPVIVLDGSAIGSPEPRGLEIIENASGSRIEGLSIGGFHLGIFAYTETPSYICANYVGVLPDGETALPNEYAGITDASISVGLRIGAECAAGGNLISGNEEFGILEVGERTLIKGNSIGITADGEPLPNGGELTLGVNAGIDVNVAARETVIGGTAPGEGNVIAYNEGQGVRVRSGASAVAIRGNSIYANLDDGIQIDAGMQTSVPKLELVYLVGGKAEVRGTIDGAPSEPYAVDVFASEACGSTGEGQAFLGEFGTSTDLTGIVSFSGKALVAAPLGSEYVTLTATAAATGATSTFSNCVVPSSPPPPPGPPAPGPPATILPIAEVPVFRESVAVAPKSGVVLVQLPGQKKAVPLEAGQTIPVGSIVDATNGKVTLSSVNRAGEAQTAVFYGGKFLVAQQESNGLVVLKLRGGNFSACKGAARESGATASGRSGRRLWGSGKGKFRTEGNYGSATVRGTVWLTVDQCKGTLFKVKRGVVSVRDFPADKTLSLPAGKSYWAKKAP